MKLRFLARWLAVAALFLSAASAHAYDYDFMSGGIYYNVLSEEDRTVEVTSTKSQTGHEMWMAGASEVIYSMLMMKNGFIAGNINFENPDEDSRHLLIPAQTVEKKFDTFLSNSFGFGGTNSTLVIRNL